MHQYNPIEHIESRLKTDESITRKLIRKGKEITVENIQKYIDDIAGVRVICSFTPDIYRIVDMISSQDDIEVLKTKDYMLNPKVNGYRSYHLIVRVPIFLSDRVVPTKVNSDREPLQWTFGHLWSIRFIINTRAIHQNTLRKN